ncbi:hypothetical protein KKH13_01085 [Patescibacteria group bacterium]|nr:hypothetical protein [Patescibacteria group bacterium]
MPTRSPDALTSHELPQNLRIVVADDDENKRLQITDALEDSLASECSGLDVAYMVDGFSLIAQAALKPDIIVLDNDYKYDREKWWLQPEDLEAVAQQTGIAYDPIKPLKPDFYVSGPMPDDLRRPNAVSFSLVLRYFGYKGKIIVNSQYPPDPIDFTRKLEDFNQYLNQFSHPLLEQPVINGVIKKRIEDTKQSFATRSDQSSWHLQVMDPSSYSQALGALIRAVL